MVAVVVVVVMCSAFAEGCIGQLTPALCTNMSVPIHSLLSHCCAAHQAGNVAVCAGPQVRPVFHIRQPPALPHLLQLR
jgi:hypothetical protein